MTVNREAFREIHQLITMFPQLHNQNFWETSPEENNTCGTTRCVAGWAVWLEAREMGLLSAKRTPTNAVIRHRVASHLGVESTDHDVIGAAVLGLTDEQAVTLFYDFNDARVAARVKSYAETGEDLPEDDAFD